MIWTAIVPVKPPMLAKTRLAGLLAREDRARLGEALLGHVLGVLDRVPAIADIVLLCETPPAAWAGRWSADPGQGLNAALEQASSTVTGPLLVIHADLPALRAEDVSRLLDAADRGIAIAPDRHRTGTNALALADPGSLRFAFGSGSFHAHRTLFPAAAIIDRPGLSHDLDTPEDFAALLDLALDPVMRGLLATMPV